MATDDVAERIMLAGERLMAEHGVEVSLRDIALAAGQRNNSAVHYYFGGRDGLIEAIVDLRMAAMEAERLELLAASEADGTSEDAYSLVAMLVAPMLDLIGQAGPTYYARFLQAARNHPAIADTARLSGADRAAVRIITSRLSRCLAEQPARLRRVRLEAMASTMFALLADLERAKAAGARMTATATRMAGQQIVDMLVGLLTAPVHTPAPRQRSNAAVGASA